MSKFNVSGAKGSGQNWELNVSQDNGATLHLSVDGICETLGAFDHTDFLRRAMSPANANLFGEEFLWSYGLHLINIGRYDLFTMLESMRGHITYKRAYKHFRQQPNSST